MWYPMRNWASEGRRLVELLPLAHKKDDNRTIDLDFDRGDRSYMTKGRRKPWIVFIVAAGFIIFIIVLAMNSGIRLGRSTWPKEDDSAAESVFSHWGEIGSDGSPRYPTDFMKDVIPKPIHSHNDYWRRVPLFTALQQGCIGVESDVWLFDEPDRRDHLYVGHDEASLDPKRTFQSLYIEPLVDMLTRQNPTTNESYNNASDRGVFDTAPNQTLVLLVDVKTAGPETWTKVVEQLEPLRERGWLTYFADGTVHSRPVTVVGTGNTPFELVVQNTTYRDTFFDAPLGKLATVNPYDATNSYYASVSFGAALGDTFFGILSEDQMVTMRRQVGEAHDKGLKARYWDLPDWPVMVRDSIWDILVDEGVDMLNVDDVKAAASREWK